MEGRNCSCPNIQETLTKKASGIIINVIVEALTGHVPRYSSISQPSLHFSCATQNTRHMDLSAFGVVVALHILAHILPQVSEMLREAAYKEDWRQERRWS